MEYEDIKLMILKTRLDIAIAKMMLAIDDVNELKSEIEIFLLECQKEAEKNDWN